MKTTMLTALFLGIASIVHADLIGDISGGGTTSATGVGSGGTDDGWNSNMVILEGPTDPNIGTYLNLGPDPVVISASDWSFENQVVQSAVTPFIVRLNADNDFTILSVGTTRFATTDYNSVGTQTFPYGGPDFVLQPGQRIGAGFIDADANGENGPASVITYNNNAVTSGEQWYDGQVTAPHTAPAPLTPGLSFAEPTDADVEVRLYHFNIEFTATAIPEPTSGGLLALGLIGLSACARRTLRA